MIQSRLKVARNLRFERVILLSLLLLLTACGREDLPRDLTVDSGFSAEQTEAIMVAVEKWNERFPGCPHNIVSIANVVRHEHGGVVHDPELEKPYRAMFWPEDGSVSIAPRLFDYSPETQQLVIMHEIAHGHGAEGHSGYGFMEKKIPGYVIAEYIATGKVLMSQQTAEDLSHCL